MKLKFTNQGLTAATFGNMSFYLAAPEDWGSIEDGPTREAVLAWLAEGNTPEPLAQPNPNDAILAQIAQLESTITSRRMREAVLGIDNGWLSGINNQIADLRSKLVR